ncbi:hypothetical protein Tco_1280531, partial [Tanacetum coccineum]
TMTDVDVNAPAELAPTMAPPTRTDDQILPHIRWVPIGKSNCYLDVDRPQSNPIFKIAVDLLKHTNFFRAFTASSAIPAIYIQQFWDTIRYDKIAGGYKCQLDEQWFDLSKDTLRDALQITPIDRNNAFSSPPTPDALIKFVNDLGYPKVVRHLSDVVTNDMFQPWRALTTIINLCLTGKTSGFERPRAPVLQILWGVINRAHVDYAERMFTKLIIHYLQSKHKFHARPGKQYYNAYLEKVAKNQRYLAGEDVTKPAPAKPREKKRKQALDAAEALSLAKRSKAGRISKKRMLQLRDEFIYEGVPVTEPRVDDEEAIVQTVLEESMKDAYPAHRGPPPLVVFREPDSGKLQPLPEVQGKGKENVGKEQAAQVLLNLQTPKKKNPAEQFIFQRCTPATAEPSSPIFVTICGTGPGCPGDAGLSRTPSSHVVHAGLNLDHMDLGIAEASSQPNTEQMDDEFTATAYPKDLSFTDQFLVEKSQEDEPKKTNTEVQVQSMVTVPILQDTSSIPLMTTPVIYITDPQSDSITVLASMPTTTETVTETTTTTVLPPPPQPQQDVSTSILIQTIGQLEQNIADLVDAN